MPEDIGRYRSFVGGDGWCFESESKALAAEALEKGQGKRMFAGLESNGALYFSHTVNAAVINEQLIADVQL